MVLYNLDTLEKVNKLTKVCDRYEIDIDVLCGRYIINGRSVLGVSSLIGNIVKIQPITDDKLLKAYVIRDLKEIGAYEN